MISKQNSLTIFHLSKFPIPSITTTARIISIITDIGISNGVTPFVTFAKPPAICTLWVDYHFKAKKDVNPRQWGMVFEAPASFDQTFWERKGLWSVYPDDHIGRTSGVAKLFYSDVPATVQPRQQPTWSWSHDANALGSNDFRSTRRNIWYAGLKDHASHEILAVSDGSQHWRAWKNGDRIQFLVADFVSPGDEMFLEGYYAKYRKPLKKGDEVKGKVTLNVK